MPLGLLVSVNLGISGGVYDYQLFPANVAKPFLGLRP